MEVCQTLGWKNHTSSFLFFWNGLKSTKCTTKATLLFLPTPSDTYRHCQVSRILSFRLLQWTFNAVGEFGIKVKTIDRWLYPMANRHLLHALLQNLLETGNQSRTHQDILCPGRTLFFKRSQSTFIAVGGLNCVDKLTEQWMQLWPRSLQSQPGERPSLKDALKVGKWFFTFPVRPVFRLIYSIYIMWAGFNEKGSSLHSSNTYVHVRMLKTELLGQKGNILFMDL